MQSNDFYTSTAQDVKTINFIVQTVKQNNSATQFTNAQETAVIAAATTAIDEINTMRTEIYDAQGITESFAAYDDTDSANTNIYTPIASDVRSLRNTFGELVAEMTYRYTNNTLQKIIDSYTNATLTKSATYTTAEGAAITAIAALKAALFV